MTQDLKQKLAELEERGELFPAIPILEQLVEDEPDNEEYKLRLAVACIDTGQVEKAEAVLRACVDGGSENPRVKLNLGHALKALGKADEAAACYLEVAQYEDDSRSAVGYWSLANMRSFRFDDLVLTELRDRVQLSDIGSPFRGLMLFALAAAWEQKENYEAAFMAMSEANLIFAAHRPFRGDLFGQMVKSMCETVKEPAALPPPDGPTPIFIVGMPRSGTTLVEQILASHSQVEATDELPFLNRIGLELEQGGGYAKALASMDEATQQKLAEEYLSRSARYRREGAPYFIDKLPHNFLHVGLIKTLFPNARIINVIRDPLDNAIGVFKMYFSEGAEYSFSMDGIIFYWQGYITLMKHWDTVYPGAVKHLSYEELAQDPDARIEELLNYCELPVEEQCFRFYESDRPVLTPSAGQVRSPISTKAIGSGQRYQKYIKTSIPALAEIKIKTREVFGIS
jgi:tetratricopeptide (TPR) repeat protein